LKTVMDRERKESLKLTFPFRSMFWTSCRKH
jgi:hypothetical protein